MLKYKLKQPTLNKITDAKVIKFLKKQIEQSEIEGCPPAPVNDTFIIDSWFINNYEFYRSKQGSFWASRENLKEIKHDMYEIEDLDRWFKTSL